MLLYHYTISDRLVKIMVDGFLKLTPKEPLAGEIPVVWLTKSREWEETAFYGHPKDALEQAGMIRITVSIYNVIPAEAYRDRIPNFEHLCSTARIAGMDPEDWFVSNQKIGFDRIRGIELWRDEKWVKVPMSKSTSGESSPSAPTVPSEMMENLSTYKKGVFGG